MSTKEVPAPPPGLRCPVAVTLVHWPVYDRQGQVVTTAITNVDLHDLARISRTFGAAPCYIATPVLAQREMCARIAGHWTHGHGRATAHPRVAAIEQVRVVETLEAAVADFAALAGARPLVAVTGAGLDRDVTRFADLRARLRGDDRPPALMVVFGTGWGLTRDITDAADVRIEPIECGSGFNHLPVRAAAAIVLDRLLGPGIY